MESGYRSLAVLLQCMPVVLAQQCNLCTDLMLLSTAVQAHPNSRLLFVASETTTYAFYPGKLGLRLDCYFCAATSNQQGSMLPQVLLLVAIVLLEATSE